MRSSAQIGGSFLAAMIMAVGLCSLPANGRAETLAEFYSGKNMRMIIGIPPGGGYDVYARLVAHHMPDYIPGHPTFIAQNMPGGGELTAANYIANTAPQDGTVVGEAGTSMDFIANSTSSIFAQGWTPELQKMVGGKQDAAGLLKAVQEEYQRELAQQ